MQTICDLKIELKKRGIKGISGLNKSQLVALLATGKSQPKKETPKPQPKPKPTPPPTIKLLKMKELSPKTEPAESNKYQTTALKTLIRLEVNTFKLMNDNAVLQGEKINAQKTLIDIEKAISLRPQKEVELERKKLLEEKDIKELMFMAYDLQKKIKNSKLPASDILRYRAQSTRLNRVIKLKKREHFNAK